MTDQQMPSDSLHLQISGELPWCVLGWHTSIHSDVEPELVAIYGPVPSQQAAELLAQSLTAITPGSDTSAKFTAMPIFAVRSTPSGSEHAPR